MLFKLLAHNKRIADSFITNYRITEESFSVEGIHKMRVSVKRLKALLRFLDYFSEKPKAKKVLKRINKLYKSAGALRDLQIQTSLLDKYSHYAGSDFNLYINQIDEKKEKALQLFKQYFFEFDLNDFIKISKKIENSINNIKSSNLIEQTSLLIQSRIKEIENLTVAITDDSVLHLIRKYLKEILYIRESISEEDAFFIIKNDKMQLISELEIKLGEWHDIKVFIDNFLYFRHKGDSHREFLGHLESDKISKQDEIIEMLYKLIIETLKYDFTA